MSHLPGTIKLETVNGDREVQVSVLETTKVPVGNPSQYRGPSSLNDSSSWDGHRASGVAAHLTSWIFPDKVQQIRDRVEAALEEGIPDQKRTMLRNQEYGMIDDRWIDDIAIGEEVENPFMRWTRAKRGETRVAICIDGTVACMQDKRMLEARMCVAAGLASALEMLDYESSILAATAMVPCHAIKGYENGPRKNAHAAKVFATVVKSEAEPFVDSGFAHLADTGLRRLIVCWEQLDNGYTTQLSDREWRELTGADLIVYIGAKAGSYHNFNNEGLPRGAKVGPQGEDVLYLNVSSHKDVDAAVKTLEGFFNEQAG